MGLSKILGVGDDSVRTSTVCGTRAYLAPEMVLRKPYGFSVDYWQFGCFLFELYAVSSSFVVQGRMLVEGLFGKPWRDRASALTFCAFLRLQNGATKKYPKGSTGQT